MALNVCRGRQFGIRGDLEGFFFLLVFVLDGNLLLVRGVFDGGHELVQRDHTSSQCIAGTSLLRAYDCARGDGPLVYRA